MPRISAFYGVTIWMYWDEGVRARPISTHGAGSTRRQSTSTVMWSSAGSRHAPLSFVSEWALLRADELQADWERTRDSQLLLPIEPLV